MSDAAIYHSLLDIPRQALLWLVRHWSEKEKESGWLGESDTVKSELEW